VILADPRDENDYEDESMDGVLVRLFEGERQVFFDGREWISWERMDFMGENGFHGRENGVLGDSRSVPHNRNCE
jgi:hypothetical protein